MDKTHVELVSMPESKLQRASELRTLLQSNDSLAQGLTNCLAVSAQTASQSDAIDASLELLELADVQRSEAMQGMREQMKDHIRGRYSSCLYTSVDAMECTPLHYRVY